MTRVYKGCSLLLMFVSFALLATGWATRSGRIVEPNAAAGLQVVEPLKSFGESVVGDKKDVSYSIVNSSAETVKIFGSRNHCGPVGCIGVNPDLLPLVIPPGGRRELSLRFIATEPGDYDMSLDLFTDCPQSPKIQFDLTGRILGQPTMK